MLFSFVLKENKNYTVLYMKQIFNKDKLNIFVCFVFDFLSFCLVIIDLIFHE